MGMLRQFATETFALFCATHNRYVATLCDPKKLCCDHCDSNWVWCDFLRPKHLTFALLCAAQNRYVATSRVEVCGLCFDRLDPRCLCFDYVQSRKNISTNFDQGKTFRPSSTEELFSTQSARCSKNPLNINEPRLDWSKWAARREIAVFAKYGIKVRNLVRARPALIEPADYKRTQNIWLRRSTEEKTRRKKSREAGWLEKRFQKAREGGVLSNSVLWEEADAEVRSFFSFYASARKETAKYNRKCQVSTCTVQQQKTSWQ